MDAWYSTGPDERDTLTAPDPEERCPDCQAHVDDACDPGCGCRDCRRRARRGWARQGRARHGMAWKLTVVDRVRDWLTEKLPSEVAVLA